MSIRTGHGRIPESLVGQIKVVGSIRDLSELGGTADVHNVGGSYWLNVITGEMAMLQT